jgi:hypothetical protein
VNRLVSALAAHPQVVEQTVDYEVAGRKNVSFGLLLDVLGDDVFSSSELQRIQDDLQLRQRLEASYLPTISAPDWEDALSRTEKRTAIKAGWWTVMIAGSSGHFGLTAPQDSSRSELVAFFIGPPATAGILVYDPSLGATTEVAGGPHCGLSIRGRCLEGTCHGCAAFEVYDERDHSTGIRCMCPHKDG